MGGIAKGVGSVVGSVFGGLAEGMGGDAQNPYQAPLPPDLMKHLQDQYGAMDPLQAQQSDLARALLAQSQGQGPNPAQMLMKQASDRATAQGAGALASAKGVNPALAARQAGMMTMANQQQTAQNAGILQAQQQIQAQNQLGNLYGQQAGQHLNQQQMLLGALGGANSINAQTAAQNAAQRGAMMGNLMGAAGTIGGAFLGGPAGAMAGGATGKAMAGGVNAQQMQSAPTMQAAHGAFVPGQAEVSGDSLENDKVHAMLSPGEIVVPRSKSKDPELAKEFIEHLFKRKKKGA